jgi:hypothetical protein
MQSVCTLYSDADVSYTATQSGKGPSHDGTAMHSVHACRQQFEGGQHSACQAQGLGFLFEISTLHYKIQPLYAMACMI